MYWARLWCLARVIISLEVSSPQGKGCPCGQIKLLSPQLYKMQSFTVCCQERDVNHSYGPSAPLTGDFHSVAIHKKLCSQPFQRRGKEDPLNLSFSQLPSMENFYWLILLQMNLCRFLPKGCIVSFLISVWESFVRGHLDKTATIIHNICRQFVNPYSVPEWLIIFSKTMKHCVSVCLRI